MIASMVFYYQVNRDAYACAHNYDLEVELSKTPIPNAKINQMDQVRKDYISDAKRSGILFIIGGGLVFLGLLFWYLKVQYYEDKILKKKARIE